MMAEEKNDKLIGPYVRYRMTVPNTLRDDDSVTHTHTHTFRACAAVLAELRSGRKRNAGGARVFGTGLLLICDTAIGQSNRPWILRHRAQGLEY